MLQKLSKIPKNSPLSIITTTKSRYEGYMCCLDPKGESVTLYNVKSCGTEDREVDKPQPGQEVRYEYIVFYFKDILEVVESPKETKPHLMYNDDNSENLVQILPPYGYYPTNYQHWGMWPYPNSYGPQLDIFQQPVPKVESEYKDQCTKEQESVKNQKVQSTCSIQSELQNSYSKPNSTSVWVTKAPTDNSRNHSSQSVVNQNKSSSNPWDRGNIIDIIKGSPQHKQSSNTTYSTPHFAPTYQKTNIQNFSNPRSYASVINSKAPRTLPDFDFERSGMKFDKERERVKIEQGVENIDPRGSVSSNYGQFETKIEGLDAGEAYNGSISIFDTISCESLQTINETPKNRDAKKQDFFEQKRLDFQTFSVAEVKQLEGKMTRAHSDYTRPRGRGSRGRGRGNNAS